MYVRFVVTDAAFSHTAAETIETIKDRKDKKKKKKEKDIEDLIEVKLLHKSLVEVSTANAHLRYGILT